MTKYRTKPIVIEAFQWLADSEKDPESWPDWLSDAMEAGAISAGTTSSMYRVGPSWFIHTLEGEHRVSENDWIIRGVVGELYPCQDNIFRLTYEAVSDD